MNIQATYGAPRDKRTTAYALIAAVMLVGMLAAQLFGYEEFAEALSRIVHVNDTPILALLAGSIVLSELLSLPYLLRMRLSKLMRVVSAVLGFGVAGFWLFACFTNAHVSNSAIFSATFELPGGLIAATWSIVLFGLICKVLFADSRFRHVTP